MSTTTYTDPALTVTVGFTALGAYLGRNLSGATGLVLFNREWRADNQSAVTIAASSFLDVLNIFLLVLDLFGGRRD